MTTPETTVTGEEAVVRYLSPPEYVKAANERDHRVEHAVDLHHFFSYLQNTAGLLRELPEDKIDVLVADYLNEVEP